MWGAGGSGDSPNRALRSGWKPGMGMQLGALSQLLSQKGVKWGSAV